MTNWKQIMLDLGLVGALFGLLTTPAATAAHSESPAAATTPDRSWDLGHGVKLEVVLIRPGTFTMGSDTDQPVHDVPAHPVTLTKPFYIGKYEVTQAQWKQLTGENPSTFQDGADADKRPVETVSWTDIQEKFLPKLADHLPPGWIVRLPTEAEWEYCCRAGTTTSFCFGDNLDGLGDYGWYEANASRTTHPVGQKQPNAWGLFDMHGNVWEWCSDWKVDYTAGAVTNPAGPATGVHRANRGGGWNCTPIYCRSARRSLNAPRSTRGGNLGFRVVVVADQAAAGHAVGP